MEREQELERRIAELESQVQALVAENQRLQAELSKYRKPPKDSSNSSIPPSQDPYRKAYSKREKSKRPAGGQEGHAGHHHPFAEPDIIEPCFPEQCDHCGQGQLLPLEGYRQTCQEVGLPELKPVVTEYRQCLGLCQKCGKTSRGRFPKHMRAPVQIEQSVSGVIGYLKQVGHMSHERIAHLFKDLFGLSVSRGFVDNRLQALTAQHRQTYEAIGKALPTEAVVGSDETRHRINGENHYFWVFQTNRLSYFVGNVSRGFEVVENIFGKQFEGVWVSDRLGSQLKIQAKHQLCLAHLIRNLQYAIDAEKPEWAEKVQTLLREAIHFRKKQGQAFDPVNNQDVFRQCQAFRDRLEILFQKPPPESEAKKLFGSLVGRQNQIFLFLSDPQVPHDNNGSERALRQPVIHRKVLGGFRSDQGSKCQDVLLSIIETAKKQSLNVIDVLCNKQPLIFQT